MSKVEAKHDASNAVTITLDGNTGDISAGGNGQDGNSSSFDNVDRVYAYDPNQNFAYKGDLRLQGGVVNRVQGGCFSNHGHLYLTSDSTKEIRAYSALNGAFLGAHGVPYAKGGVDQEEMEGITILHWYAAGGISTHVHVVILDNDATNKDDVFLKHFTVPDPNVV
jgi:hypothetical protein